jgi:hypothetical protein
MLNPVHRGSTADAIERYKVEPYVMGADIYGAAPHTGRGGWTRHTGAAGWMYRLTVETLLGLHLEVDHLRIAHASRRIGIRTPSTTAIARRFTTSPSDASANKPVRRSTWRWTVPWWMEAARTGQGVRKA